VCVHKPLHKTPSPLANQIINQSLKLLGGGFIIDLLIPLVGGIIANHRSQGGIGRRAGLPLRKKLNASLGLA
jgi:hypothetical protein